MTLIEEETLVRPDETLQAETSFLKDVIGQARHFHAQSIISVQRPEKPSAVATVTLPEAIVDLLFRVAENLSKGRTVALMAFNSRLSTHQAARFLGMSRPHLIKLLEKGEIDYTKVGTHRRIKFEDLVKFKESRDAKRRAALDDMTRTLQEEGVDYMGENFSVDDTKK
jgi:excisionase family DNA binding protein